MRNLKKILALVLALVMSLSLMATAGAADFSDKDQISDKYSDAVTVLNGLEVFKGYDNGARFEPQGDITRAEVAAIIYRIATGDVSDTQKDIYSTWGLFTDVADGSWYAGYVNYCANAGYIKGRGNKIFDPNGKVTGYEALAMILRAIGYDKNNEFSGSNWQVNTASIAKQRGITNNITDTLLGQAATREVVAEILFQAILVPTVTFNTATISYTNNATSLGKDVLNLDKVTGVVVANEYANVQDDDLKVLAEGKTQLRVAAGDVRTLDLGTDLNDVGMSENAYIQGSKVLLISEAANTVFDNTDKNGEHVDLGSASKFSDVTSLSKNDNTEFFVDFDHSTEHKANRRIEMRVIFRDANAEKEFDNYSTVDISVVAAENGYTVIANGTDITTKGIADYQEQARYGYPVEYVKVFRLEDVVQDNDLSVLRGIFGMADDNDVTSWGVEGKVFVGTNSQEIASYYYDGDKSNTMSYRAFKEEYIDTDIIKNWSTSNDGEWVKVIDNNGDGVAEYAFKTTFTLDKAVNTYTKDDNSTLRYYALDLVNGDYTGRYLNTVAEGDIVLHTTIDGQALIWKANTAEDTITKINDIYKRSITATTGSGDVYSQSEIYNASRLDQRIEQMDEAVNYHMYLDAFGRIRAYEPVDGTKYALITEMYYGNLQNGRYVKNDILTAELKAGDAGLTERVVNNPLNNDFILTINGQLSTWSQLDFVMNNYQTNGDISYYTNRIYRDISGFYNPITTLTNWSNYVILQPAVANLGFNNGYNYDARDIFDNATTNIARYVINADGTVNLNTAAQLNYNADGTLAGNYSVNYVELNHSSVTSKQNVYTGKITDADFSTRVDANNETEYYIVSDSGVEHFVGFSNLPAISGIRAMYSVARNTSTDKDKLNYWVADVIVIEADNYSAQPDDYLFIIGRADMVGNDTLANRQAVGSQYLLAISAKQGGVVRITTNNLNWGVGTVTPGFYKAYGVTEVENGTLTIDRLSTRIIPDNVNNVNCPNDVNTSNFKLRAGTVNHTAGINDRFGVEFKDGSIGEQITLKGPSYAIIQDGRGKIDVSTRLNGDNYTNQVIKGRDILWVEDNSHNALFTIDVTWSEKESDDNSYIASLLRYTWDHVAFAEKVNGDEFTVTVKGVYNDGTTDKDDGVVYLEKANGGYWNATGSTFTVKKGTDLLFKVTAGNGFTFDSDVKDAVSAGNDEVIKPTNLGTDWYEIKNITGNVTIEVKLTLTDYTTRQVKVQSNISNVLTGTLSTNNPVRDSSIIITGVPAGNALAVESVMIGFTLVDPADYEFDNTTNKITFTKDLSATKGDIVVVVNVFKITEVGASIPVPAVAKLAEKAARNGRLAVEKVPLFFVNNDRDMAHYVLEGNNFIYELSPVKVGQARSISFQYNTEANADMWGEAVEITVGDESVILTLSDGGNASLTYKVKGNVPTDVAEVEPAVNAGEFTFTVEGQKVDANDSVNVYKVTGDTQVLNVRVSGLKAGSAEIYAVSNDTTVSNVINGTNGQLKVSAADTNQVVIKVNVTFNGKTETYSYTVNFVSKAGTADPNPDVPTTPENPDTSDPTV